MSGLPRNNEDDLRNNRSQEDQRGHYDHAVGGSVQHPQAGSYTNQLRATNHMHYSGTSAQDNPDMFKCQKRLLLDGNLCGSRAEMGTGICIMHQNAIEPPRCTQDGANFMPNYYEEDNSQNYSPRMPSSHNHGGARASGNMKPHSERASSSSDNRYHSSLERSSTGNLSSPGLRSIAEDEEGRMPEHSATFLPNTYQMSADTSNSPNIERQNNQEAENSCDHCHNKVATHRNSEGYVWCNYCDLYCKRWDDNLCQVWRPLHGRYMFFAKNGQCIRRKIWGRPFCSAHRINHAQQTDPSEVIGRVVRLNNVDWYPGRPIGGA